jgi:hypothetical protein
MVTFVTDAGNLETNANISVQLDSDRNGGKTRFLYGEKAYYQIFFSPETMTITQTASDGTISAEGSGEELIEEYVTFANTNNGNTNFPVNRISSSEWLGNNLGAISYVSKQITSSLSGTGILKVSYYANFTRYAISIPEKSDPEYYVVIYLSGSIAEGTE